MSLSNDEQAIEAEYYRLGQELLKLKQQGHVAKHIKLRKTKVKRLVIAIGLPKLKTLSYLEFADLCKQHKI